MQVIRIATDFSRTPGARYITDGLFSGEQFRISHLEPLFTGPNSDETIEVDLDGTSGYATSFLEESFGGLARIHGKTAVLRRIKIKSDEDPSLIREIEKYIEDANGF